jgi:SAM-dependent methyltransferase
VSNNKQVYENRRVVGWYRAAIEKGLTPPERFCLSFANGGPETSVLDVGVGAGRTTGPLREMFGHYVGFDYSERMVEAARASFPGVDFRVMDARDMRFEEKFDCIVFSYNGIDVIDFRERPLVFASVAKLLKDDGVFIYSTKSLAYKRVKSWQNSFFVREMFKNWRWVVQSIPNRLRSYGKQHATGAYARVNDPSEVFRLVVTYTDVEKELALLESYGFNRLATVGQWKDAEGYDENDEWVYIALRKGPPATSK